ASGRVPSAEPTSRGGSRSLDSAIEASKIAGHSHLEMTGEYTFVTPERQNELARRIQQKLEEAGKQNREGDSEESAPAVPTVSEVPSSLAELELATQSVQ